MQHYAGVPQIRHAQQYVTAGVANRQPGAPIGTIQQAAAPAQRMPLHQVAAAQQVAAQPRVVQHHPAVVQQQQAASVAPPAAQPAKIQPQLQQLPRFRPPAFEGENGSLPLPDSPGSTPRSGRKSLAGKQLQEAKIDEKTGLFLPGSTVEYKSRSSGQWIIAQVLNYDENNRTYRLDVQPHAQPDRVRARERMSGSASSAAVAATSPDGDATDASPSVNQDASAITAATPSRPIPAEVNGGSNNGADVAGNAANLDAHALLSENNALKMQLSLLQAENAQLHEQVASESALKDRYYQELRACHEQLQRVRGTPR